MKKIRKIKLLPFALFQAFLFGLLGLLAGVMYSFGGLLVDALVSFDILTSQETPGLSEGTMLAFGALVGMPILFAGAGLLTGFLEAVLYNLAAMWWGGFHLDIFSEE